VPVVRQVEGLGLYYEALSLSRGSTGDIARADSVLEQVADNASSRYRARAMLGLGTNALAVGDRKGAMSF
jgi:hypothetical protein